MYHLSRGATDPTQCVVDLLLHTTLASTLRYRILFGAWSILLTNLVHYIAQHLLVIDSRSSCSRILLLINDTHNLADVACAVYVGVAIGLICEGVIDNESWLIDV